MLSEVVLWPSAVFDLCIPLVSFRYLLISPLRHIPGPKLWTVLPVLRNISAICGLFDKDLGRLYAVYGPVILTRGANSQLGSFINRNLIRVKLSEDSTALHLRRIVRDSQAQVSAQSHLLLRDVIEDYTDWPSSDSLASYVTQLPADTATPTFSLQDTKVSYQSTDAHINPRNQIFVRSMTTGQYKSGIQMRFSGAVMDSKDASWLAARILETAQVLSASPEEYLRPMEVLHSREYQD